MLFMQLEGLCGIGLLLIFETLPDHLKPSGVKIDVIDVEIGTYIYPFVVHSKIYCRRPLIRTPNPVKNTTRPYQHRRTFVDDHAVFNNLVGSDLKLFILPYFLM